MLLKMKSIQAIRLLLLSGMAWMLPADAFAQGAQAARDADRGSQFYVNAAVARAAGEKVLAQMTADFYANGETVVDTNLAFYSSLVPSASDNSYWSNYVFLNRQTGASNTVSITPQYLNSNVVVTTGELQGMSAFQSLFRIQSYVHQANNSDSNLIGGTELDVTLNTVPLFEFGIYYNSLLEFTTAPTLVLTGPIHCNTNIYYGSAAGPLTFELPVTSTGIITDPPWGGDTVSDFTNAIIFNGSPAPGYSLSQPAIYLPIGASNNAPTNMIQIIYPPMPGDNLTMTQQRYYNKAEMLIMVSNSTFTPFNNLVIVKLQAATNGLSYLDTGPYWFTNINPATGLTNALWATNGFDSWLSTTNSFYDFRQTQYMRTTQINVSNFNTWCTTNFAIYNRLHGTNKFSATTPLNIIYVADWRATNSTTNAAVRLRGGGSTNFPPYGLTVATPNPLYVWGNYDTPTNANLNSTNVIGTYPTSFISDALTILSGNWVDNYSSSSPASSRPASSTTVNGAILTGMVYSTGPGGTGTTQFSGGLQNLPRLLENWSSGGAVLTLNTSFVNLFPSAVATAPFVWPATGTVYGVPTIREFYFNQSYNSPAGLPPGTPFVTLVQRTGQTLLNPSGTPP